MRDCVTVSVGARLHLGFLDLNGGLGRRFGSLGLAIDEPQTRRRAEPRPARQRRWAAGGARRRGTSTGLQSHLGLPAGHRLVMHEADRRRMPGSARARSSRSPSRRRCAGCTALPLDVRRRRAAARPQRALRARHRLLPARRRRAGRRARRRRPPGPDHRPPALSRGLARAAHPRSHAAGRARRRTRSPRSRRCRRFPAETRRASLPARADAGAAGGGRRRPRALRRRRHGNPGACRRLFRAGAGRPLCEPRCRSGARSPRGARRRRLWAKLLGTDRLRACRVARARRGSWQRPRSRRSRRNRASSSRSCKGRNRRGGHFRTDACQRTRSAAWLSRTSCT